VIDPEDETVSVFRPHAERTLAADDELNLDDVVPGFRCRVGEIFE
jgi:Uma2 family endonuclease